MNRMSFLAAVLLLPVTVLRAETGYDAWLRYVSIDDPSVRQMYAELPATVVTAGASPVLTSAGAELSRGIFGMLGRHLRQATQMPGDDGCILLGTLDSIKPLVSDPSLPQSIPTDGYLLKTTATNGHPVLLVTGSNDRGVLFGAFALLRTIQLHHEIAHLNESESPSAPIRWTNEWDNLDGSIERGYAGRSIFFEGGNVRPDLTRAADYARLLSSIGINGCTVNNVNANPKAISTEFLPQLARIADAFRPWGVR